MFSIGKNILRFSKRYLCSKTNNICPDFHLNEKLADALNNQIHSELTAAYNYVALTSYFGQQKQSLPGFASFHRKQVEEEQNHANILITLLLSRGGTLILSDIPKPSSQSWNSPLNAFEYAYNLEKAVLEKLNELQCVAMEVGDHHATNLIQSQLLEEQIRSIDEIIRIVCQLEKIKDNPVGIQILDSQMLEQRK